MHQFTKDLRAMMKAFIKDNPDPTDDARQVFFNDAEELAIAAFGPVIGHNDDGFGPPAEPVEVCCMHCRLQYSSSEIVRQYRPAYQDGNVSMLGKELEVLEPMWWCKKFNCDGAGFNFDIHPINDNRVKGVVAEPK